MLSEVRALSWGDNGLKHGAEDVWVDFLPHEGAQIDEGFTCFGSKVRNHHGGVAAE